MKIYDISQTLKPGLPVWPGDTEYNRSATWSMASGSPVAVSKLTMSTHSGTHADAPAHYDAHGLTSEAVDLSAYMGDAIVLDLSAQSIERLEIEHLESPLAGYDKLKRVLIRLYAAFPHQTWVSDFPGIAPDAIHWLADKGCKLIGVDTPSLDPQDSKTMDAHKAVQARDMRILEGLVLDDVPDGTYELIALPLKLQGSDASPVRAILRKQE